jgi:hypothetical protein
LIAQIFNSNANEFVLQTQSGEGANSRHLHPFLNQHHESNQVRGNINHTIFDPYFDFIFDVISVVLTIFQPLQCHVRLGTRGYKQSLGGKIYGL